MLARSIITALVCSLATVPFAAPALAAPTPAPCIMQPAPTVNPGMLAGAIKCVNGDPANQSFNITSGDKTYTVYVPQGSLVQPAEKLVGTASAYRSFTDLRAGSAVTVYTTLTAGKVTATIVTLAK